MNKLREEQKQKRSFLPPDLTITKWDDISPYIDKLLKTPINNSSELKTWLDKRSELEAILEEDKAWLYIQQSCHTNNESYAQAFSKFVTEIDQKLSSYINRLNTKLVEYCKKNEYLPEYEIFLRGIRKEIEIFREENVSVHTELEIEEQKYGGITGAMSINYDGQDLTLQQAQNYLKKTDRTIRRDVYNLIAERRLRDRNDLDKLFDHLLGLRHRLATNAGYKNYLEYRFAELKRFDYKIKDCEEFHRSVAENVTPFFTALLQDRKKKLDLETLAPYDLDVDSDQKEPLMPFRSATELVQKTSICFSEIDASFGEYIDIMEKNGYLDLESRKGKAPGGYNYPLYESNVPFIFMNATNNLRDLETMMHEGGHAIHSFISKDLRWVYYKELPAEIAEVASMSMELISMEHWHHFFPDEEELKRAKKSQLEGILGVLPWIATIDKFQHWLYTHPGHSTQDRQNAWLDIYTTFHGDIVDWNGFESARSAMWQKQIHLFQFPLYYIEYGIAQLGAIAVWKNYKENPVKAINAYKKALSLGYSCSIPELFRAANINFDFSSRNINSLTEFIQSELNSLND